MKLNPKRFAIAVGIVWGLYVLLTGWIAAAGWGNYTLVNTLSAIYLGFKPTFVGGIVGGLWGVLDGLIGGYLLIYLYNKQTAKRK